MDRIKQMQEAIAQAEGNGNHRNAVEDFIKAIDVYDEDIYSGLIFPARLRTHEVIIMNPRLRDNDIEVTVLLSNGKKESVMASSMRSLAIETMKNLESAVEAYEFKRSEEEKAGAALSDILRINR